MKTINIVVDDEINVEAAVEGAIQNITDKIINLLDNRKFTNYLAKKIELALNNIAQQEVGSINNDALDGTGTEKTTYLNAMGYEIRNNSIVIFNNSVVNIATKNLRPEIQAKYPLQLSLADIIEYGTGHTGSTRSNAQADNWEYDINQHGHKGWFYVDANGNAHWTNGLKGRYVFLKLRIWVEDNIKDIIGEYLSKNIKD